MKGIGASIKKHQKAIGIGMAAVGASIVATGVKSVKAYAEMGDEVGKMARKTGFSAVTLSELRHAAELSGTSLTGFEKATKRMAAAIGDAQDGLLETKRDFDKLGISIEDLEGLSPEEAFLKIGQAIGDLEDPLVRANVAQGIFGRAGMDLIPMFDQGAEALAGMRTEAHELGIVFDQEAATKAEEFTDAMHRMDQSTMGVKMAIADNLVPALMPLIDGITKVVKGISAWIKENPDLSSTLTIAGTALGILSATLGGLILIMPGLTAALATFGITLHLALGPIALIILGIAGLVAAGIALWKNWDKVSAFLERAWVNIKIFFLNGVRSILDSLSQFTRFIPGLNKLVDSAKEKIANMIEAEQLKKDLLDVKDRLNKTTEAIEDNVGALIENSEAITAPVESTGLWNDALEEEQLRLLENNKQLEAYREQQEALQRQYEQNQQTVKRTIDQIEYERSEAGKLGVTIDDVIEKLYDMGWTEDKITQALVDLGEESQNVNAFLQQVGLTAIDVAEALGMTSEAVDELKKKVKAAAQEKAYAQGDVPTGSIISSAVAAWFARTGGRSYGIGGIALTPQLAKVADKGPELMLPLNKVGGLIGKTVNIYVELDGRTIARAMGAPLVEQIRVKTGLKL